MEDKGNRPLDPEFSNAFIRDIANFIDANIQAARYSTIGLAAIGVVLIGRSVHIWGRFRNVSEIPKRLIDKNVSLQGTLQKVGVNGTLYVEHIPIISSGPKKNADPLPIKLFAVDNIQEPGLQWLEKSMKNRHVWFQMMALRNKELECVVYYQGPFFNRTYANDYLVKKGLATVEPAQTPTGKIHEKYLDKLIELEINAQKRGRGMWAPPPIMERVKARSRKYVDDKVDAVKLGIHNRIDSVKTNVYDKVDGVKTDVYNRADRVKSDAYSKVDNVVKDVQQRVSVVTTPVINTYKMASSTTKRMYGAVRDGISAVKNGITYLSSTYNALKTKIQRFVPKQINK